jgi:pyruvate-formate lyase-activating enzyme
MTEANLGNGQAERALKPPLAMLAELTHRCPLQCPYCSNPLELTRRSDELETEEWADVFRQAAALGALQVHLSGGEPTARKDLPALVAAAHGCGLYTNLITAGVLLSRDGLVELAAQGLDHVQLSIQDSEPVGAERIGHLQGGHARKLAFAAWVRETGLPLTVNAVVHRQNLDHLEDIIALAHGLEAHRLEIAHVQYYGWALQNRAWPRKRVRICAARWSSTMWCPTTTPAGQSAAWTAGAISSSPSRRAGACCPATPPRRSPASASPPCASGRSPGSGSTTRPSTSSAGSSGCRNPAAAANSASVTSAVADARPSP